MSDLDTYYQSGGMVNPLVGAREYTTADVAKQFDELMSVIQTQLKKTPYSQENANTIALSLNELYMLQKKGGFEYSMNDAATLLFAVFKNTGYDPTATPPKRSIDLKSLQEINDKGLAYQGKNIAMTDIIAMIDTKNFAQATNTLGDSTLDFVRWAYNNYADQVNTLAQSVDAAKSVIGNLTSLQNILNHVQTKMPDNYKFPPEKWSDIPADLQAKVKANYSGDAVKWDQITNDPNNPEFKKVLKYVTNPPGSQDYVNWSDTYFKTQLGTTAAPQPGDIPAILNMRDNLIRQMAILKKGGAPTGDGTPYDTISKLVDTINQKFPPSTYPLLVPNPNSPADSKTDLRPGKNWDAEFGSPPTFDKIKQKYPNAQQQITDWINSGQGTGTTTNDLLDQALNANQRLSDDMSKQLQAQNQQLSQVMDMLTQLIDALNKILSGTAQKIARG